MLKIRLARAGRKNLPFFRVVLTEHTRAPKNWYKKVLWSYDPIKKIFELKDIEEIKKYLSNGVQMSDRVKKLMDTNSIKL